MAGPKASGQRRVLQALKRSAGATAQDIARELGITAVAVRKHLVALEAEGLVRQEARSGGRGRPALVYHVSEKGEATFPQGYHDLVVDLLHDLNDLGGQVQLDHLFHRRNERLAHTYQIRLAGKSLPEAVQELARARDAEGYMASVESSDHGFVLSEHNCPIIAVAERFPTACQCERELFERLLNAPVKREATLAEGGSACRYHIQDHDGE
jgi:predicted ArsR family transcriptional regulator